MTHGTRGRRAVACGRLARAALALGLACAALTAQASWQFCATQDRSTAAEKDRVFRLAALIKARLAAAGSPAALVSRSGTDLARLGLRYSHAGIALRDNPQGAWAVRQLYFACDEEQARLFDQGMAGFVLGMDEPRVGYVSVVLLPREAAEPLARTALTREQALSVLNADYSANAHAWSLRYQNCNQWLAELLALSWAPLGDGSPGGASVTASEATPRLRQAAQAWLKSAGYQPTTVQVPWRPMMWAAAFVPWLHDDDHPPEDLAAARYQVSLPDALEAFARQRWPQAQRLEFCHRDRMLVVRQGWTPLPEGCTPGPDDEVIALD